MHNNIVFFSDAERLQHTFGKRGFLVRRYDNLTDIEMMTCLAGAAKEGHERFDCFVCSILTHGVLNHLYGVNGELIPMRNLTAPFQADRCPSLAGKPKLFFLQTCQGVEKMGGEKIGNKLITLKDEQVNSGGSQTCTKDHLSKKNS